jgi:biopolymer transport protein ExbD
LRSTHSGRPRHISFKMTALIDMAFLLITFFVMSIRFGQAGEEEIKLPDADQAQETSDERNELITVNVNANGDFIIKGIHHEAGDLLSLLNARKSETDKEIELTIRADRDAAFEKVQRAMRVAAEAGIPNLSFAALQKPEPGEQTEPTAREPQP